MLAFFLAQLETEEGKRLFEDIFNEHFSKVVSVAREILNSQDLAEQVAIDTFWLLSQKFEAISKREKYAIRAWLLITAKYTAWHVLENKSAKKRVPEDCVEFPDEFAAPVVEERIAELLEAVGKMPEKYRRVVQLYYFGGYLAREIAEILGLKTNTVEQQLSRARKILKEMLVDEK